MCLFPHRLSSFTSYASTDHGGILFVTTSLFVPIHTLTQQQQQQQQPSETTGKYHCKLSVQLLSYTNCKVLFPFPRLLSCVFPFVCLYFLSPHPLFRARHPTVLCICRAFSFHIQRQFSISNRSSSSTTNAQNKIKEFSTKEPGKSTYPSAYYCSLYLCLSHLFVCFGYFFCFMYVCLFVFVSCCCVCLLGPSYAQE